MPHGPPAHDVPAALERRLAVPCRIAIAHPRWTLAIGLALVLAAASGLPRLTLRTDGYSLVPVDSPDVRTARDIHRRFGLHDQFIVLLRTDDADGIFNAGTLALLRGLTEEIAALAEVDPEDVVSLATERGDRVAPGTLTVRTFLEPLPETPRDVARLREDFRRIDLYTGTLVSRDERAAAIFVGVDENTDRAALHRRLTALLAGHDGDRHALALTGGPVAELLLGTHIMDDLGVPRRITGSTIARGAPVRGSRGALPALRGLVARTIGLVPVALLVMALVLLLFFRSVGAVLLTLGEVGACLLFVLGVMGHAGVPIYLTVAVMPVILTAVGIADEIHVFHRYRDHVRSTSREGVFADHGALVVRTMKEMARPVVQTSLTTAIGFGSFALSPIGAVRAFGGFTALGILFCMAFSLTVVPACLAAAPPHWFVPLRRGRPPAGHRGLAARLAGGIVRRRAVVVLVAGAVLVAAPFGAARLVVQDSWIDGFSRDSAFYQDITGFNRDFLGAHVLHVALDSGGFVLEGEVDRADLSLRRITLPGALVDDPSRLIGAWVDLRVEEPADAAGSAPRRLPIVARIVRVEREADRVHLHTGRPGPVLSTVPGVAGTAPVRYTISRRPFATPEVMSAACGLEAFLRGRSADAVGGVLGPCAYVRTTNFLLGGRQEHFRRTPETAMRMNLVWSHFDRVRGPERRRQLVQDGFNAAVVTAFLTEANFRSTKRLVDALRRYEAEHLAPRGITLSLAGDVAVSQTLIDAVVRTQVRSLLVSLLGILVFTALLGRSFVWGVYCVLPCAIAVLVNFAAMGVFGVPLGVATSMFAGMTLGIGVDFAIHLMERCRHARARGLEAHAAIVDAFAATGPAVAIDALAVTLGFGVLLLSQVPANARLGGLLALSVLSCLLATLVLLPALISLRPPAVLRAEA